MLVQAAATGYIGRRSIGMPLPLYELQQRFAICHVRSYFLQPPTRGVAYCYRYFDRELAFYVYILRSLYSDTDLSIYISSTNSRQIKFTGDLSGGYTNRAYSNILALEY